MCIPTHNALVLALVLISSVLLASFAVVAKSANNPQGQSAMAPEQLLPHAMANPPDPAIPGPPYEFTSPQAVVPVRLVANTLLVSASLNHQGSSELLFDSGAENSITPEIAKRLGLKVQWGLQAVGFGNKILNVGRTKIASVQIGGVTLFNQTFYVVPLPYAVNRGLNTQIAGSLGYQVLRQLPVTINYQDGTLTLHDARAFHYTGNGVAVPFVLSDREPVIQGSIDGIPGIFRIDTGSASSLSLFAPFVAGKKLIQRLAARLHGFAGEGLGGPETAYFARAHTLSLGGAEVHGLPAELLEDTGGIGAQTDESGDIGTQTLKQFNVTFDYPDRMIYLEKNANYDRPDAFDRSGLALRIEPEGLVVMSVLNGSPAEEAGIRAGDRIVSVDQHAGNQITAPFLFNVFRQTPGTQVQLRISRDGVDSDVSLKLREIL